MRKAYNENGQSLGFEPPIMRVGESLQIDNANLTFKGKLKKIIHVVINGEHRVEHWFKVKEFERR